MFPSRTKGSSITVTPVEARSSRTAGWVVARLPSRSRGLGESTFPSRSSPRAAGRGRAKTSRGSHGRGARRAFRVRLRRGPHPRPPSPRYDRSSECDGITPTVLNDRTKELREAEFVVLEEAGPGAVRFAWEKVAHRRSSPPLPAGSRTGRTRPRRSVCWATHRTSGSSSWPRGRGGGVGGGRGASPSRASRWRASSWAVAACTAHRSRAAGASIQVGRKHMPEQPGPTLACPSASRSRRS